MDIQTILMIFGIIGLGFAAAGENRRARKFKKQFGEAVEAGLELQRHALANDKALREGLDDQEEALSAEILDRDDKIKELTEQRDASRANLNRLLTRISDLETAHAMHSDHCLPVLAEMREASKPEEVDLSGLTEAEKYLVTAPKDVWQTYEEARRGDAANS